MARRARTCLRRAISGGLPEPGAQRTLAASVLVSSVGGGLLLGSSTLYLTRIIGLPPVRVGLGLTVGALLGLTAGPVVGHLADRRGCREVQIAATLCGAAATAGFVLVRTFWALVLVSLLTSLVAAAAQASRGPLVRALAGNGLTRFLSYLRAVTNLGIVAGLLIAAAGIQLDSGPVYVIQILVSAVTFLGAGAILAGLPRVPPVPLPTGRRRWVALADRPYLTVTLLNGAMSLHFAIPAFALPLWIIGHTHAPRPAVSGVLLVNGLMIVALQVRASRGIVDVRSAGQRMRWAGAALLVSTALIAATTALSPWSATLVLLTAVIAYTAGELWHASASFELAFALARPQEQGQYSGVFGLGQGAANAAAPAALATLALDNGPPGWLIVGGLLMGTGLLTPIAVRWAERSQASAVQPGNA